MAKRSTKEYDPQRVRLGQRMKQAALAEGLTGGDIAAAMGLKAGREQASTIYKYWSGQDRISLDRLMQYAEVVHKPMAWFFDEEQAMAGSEFAAQVLANVARSVLLRGTRLDEALDQATAEPGSGGAALRASLRRANPYVADWLRAQVGEGWESLPEERQRELLRPLVETWVELGGELPPPGQNQTRARRPDGKKGR